jgi:hypothetical protein
MNNNALTRNTQYTAARGSTIITLHASHLDTLAVGRHSLQIRFTDGAAVNTNITVQAAPIPTPTPEPAPWINPFADVNGGDWFFDAVR